MPFEHYPVNAEALSQEKSIVDKEAASTGIPNAFFLKNPGVYQFRILPPYSGGGKWYHKYEEYTINVDKQFNFVPVPEAGLPDPVPEVRQALFDEKNKESIDKAKSLSSSRTRRSKARMNGNRGPSSS